MFNSKQFKKVLLVGLVASSFAASSQSTNPSVDTPVSLTINNAFSIVEGDVLSFGVIRASQTGVIAGTHDFATGAGIRILTNGSVPEPINPVVANGADATSAVTVISAGTPGTYNITGAIPNADLQILSPVVNRVLDDADTAATSGSFQLNIPYLDMRVTGGPNAGSPYTEGTPNLTTDSTGATQLTVGGRLTILGTAPSVEASTYTGTYSLTISY